ncbi:hypothetical protein SEA_REYNAULD_64 [Rhodococcus phage Reynauld]|uniref:Uncharacterized protein n=1 Tax=Rhodococcus phage Reynauld TaxID=3062845 RepID=A0ACD4ULI9_9CAUD|nr:hypothetical protein SEA_REYNAULD_64 [Rhodococcus phage Reynauld]
MNTYSPETTAVLEEMVCVNLAFAMGELIEAEDFDAAVTHIMLEVKRRGRPDFYPRLGKMSVAYRDAFAPFYKMISEMSKFKETEDMRGALICLWNADKAGLDDGRPYLDGAIGIINGMVAKKYDREQREAREERDANERAEYFESLEKEKAAPAMHAESMSAKAFADIAAANEVGPIEYKYANGADGWGKVSSVRRGKGGIVSVAYTTPEGQTTQENYPNKTVLVRWPEEQ